MKGFLRQKRPQFLYEKDQQRPAQGMKRNPYLHYLLWNFRELRKKILKAPENQNRPQTKEHNSGAHTGLKSKTGTGHGFKILRENTEVYRFFQSITLLEEEIFSDRLVLRSLTNLLSWWTVGDELVVSMLETKQREKVINCHYNRKLHWKGYIIIVC